MYVWGHELWYMYVWGMSSGYMYRCVYRQLHISALYAHQCSVLCMEHYGQLGINAQYITHSTYNIEWREI